MPDDGNTVEEPGRAAMFEPREVSFAAAMMFSMIVLYAAVQVAIPAASTSALRTPYLGADFAEFYMFHSLDRRNQDASVWYVCAPHLALLFRPFALLPYRAAYLAWIVAAILIYGSGILALKPYLLSLPEPYRKAAVLVGLSFAPFAIWSIVGGQIGVIAFAVIAWCVRLDLAGRYVAAGATLALCSYKPTLLLLFGLFLLVRMNLRLLGGFAAGLGGILAVSLLTTGTQTMFDWFALMSTYGRFASNGKTPWPTAWPQLIDLNHFVRRIVASDNSLPIFVAVAALLGAVAVLGRHWRRFDRATEAERQVIWAVTITASLLANLYVMTYDSVSIVAGGLLTAAVICTQKEAVKLAPRFHAMVAFVYFAALVPAPAIAFLQVHPYTLALAALTVFQYRVLGGVWLPNSAAASQPSLP